MPVMQRVDIAKIVRRLSAPPHSIAFEAGLSEREIRTVVERFAFRFPPDVVNFLRYALPIAPRFPNWRNPESPALQEQIDAPTAHLAAAPKLIPIYAHRYICEAPHAEGNPILSVSPTGIIYYAANFADYLEREFFADHSGRL